MEMKEKGDFTAELRLLWITGLAVAIGALCAVVAYVLLHLIFWFTNLFYYGQFSFAEQAPAGSPLGAWAVLVPVSRGVSARY